jgi:hypothetical protein
MDPEIKILKFPGTGTEGPDTDSRQQNRSQTAASATLSASAEPPPPIWMQRFFLISIVIFCLWVGLVLSVLPWTPVWTENNIVIGFPRLRALLSTGFVRGLATGLGLLDLWIGISEAVQYRDRR